MLACSLPSCSYLGLSAELMVLALRPYTLYKYAEWQALWWYRIEHCKQDLTDDDRHYLILKNSGMSKARMEVRMLPATRWRAWRTHTAVGDRRWIRRSWTTCGSKSAGSREITMHTRPTRRRTTLPSSRAQVRDLEGLPHIVDSPEVCMSAF